MAARVKGMPVPDSVMVWLNVKEDEFEVTEESSIYVFWDQMIKRPFQALYATGKLGQGKSLVSSRGNLGKGRGKPSCS